MNIEVIPELCAMYLYVRNKNRPFSHKLDYFPHVRNNIACWIGEECDNCYNDIDPCNDGDGCNYIKSWDISIVQLKELMTEFDSVKMTEFLNNESNHYPDLEKQILKFISLKAFW